IDWDTVKQSRAGKAVEVPNVPATAGVTASDQLTIGARGDSVKRLQTALAQLGFAVGDVDGIYGNQTASAVRLFQASRGLPPTGTADDATLQAITAPQTGGTTMQPEDVVRALIAALLGNQPTAVSMPAPNNAATTPSTQNILQLVLNALVAKKSTAPPSAG